MCHEWQWDKKVLVVVDGVGSLITTNLSTFQNKNLSQLNSKCLFVCTNQSVLFQTQIHWYDTIFKCFEILLVLFDVALLSVYLFKLRNLYCLNTCLFEYKIVK